MVTVTFAELESWISLFFWPFCRFTGLFISAPILSHSSIPNRVKLAVVAILSILVGPLLPAMPEVPLFSWASFGIIVEQLVIGAAIGVVMQIIFAAIQAAGEYIGLQMGLAFASFFSPDSGTNTMILSRFFFVFSSLLFVTIDGHLLLIETLVRSFAWLPIASVASLPSDIFMAIVRFGSVVFSSGILLALPVFGALLIVNLTLGILNRSAPQLTVFSVGFPMSLTLGMVLLVVLMTELGAYLQALFQLGFQFLDSLFLV